MLADDSQLAERIEACLINGKQNLAESLAVLQKTASSIWPEAKTDLPIQPLETRADFLTPWLRLGYNELGKLVLSKEHGKPLPPSRTGQDERLEVALALISHGLSETSLRQRTEDGPEIVGFGDPAAASKPMWSALLFMLQEGGDFVSDLTAPSDDQIRWFHQQILQARRLIARVDPTLDGLMNNLQRQLILAEPGPIAREAGQSFGGATAFFHRGASILNASRRPTAAAMVELLVHEYAHAELFALGQEEVLCLNSDDELHPVLIRSDPRPMHGILHSLHVVSRVVGVIEKILLQPMETFADGGESMGAFRNLLDSERAFGQSSLAAVRRHARLTPLGEAVVEAAAWRLEQSCQLPSRQASLPPAEP